MNSIKLEDARDVLQYIRFLARKHYELDTESLMKLITGDCETPKSVLRVIAISTTNSEYLARIASNPNTSGEILHKLAKHELKQIRLAVAGNPNASGLAVRPLTFDDSPTVRFTLAENPSTDVVVLEKLRRDVDPFVAHRAGKTLRIVRAQAI